MKLSFPLSRLGMIFGSSLMSGCAIIAVVEKSDMGIFPWAIVAIVVGAVVCYGSQIANIEREKELRRKTWP